MAGTRMYHKTRWLINDNQIVIFIYNVQWDILWYKLNFAWWFRKKHLDKIARLYLTCVLAADWGRSVLDSLLVIFGILGLADDSLNNIDGYTQLIHYSSDESSIQTVEALGTKINPLASIFEESFNS